MREERGMNNDDESREMKEQQQARDERMTMITKKEMRQER